MSNYIPGIQYSHYCGTELLELVSAQDNAYFEMKKGNIDECQKWLKYIADVTVKLRDKIANLDKVNGMKY